MRLSAPPYSGYIHDPSYHVTVHKDGALILALSCFNSTIYFILGAALKTANSSKSSL